MGSTSRADSPTLPFPPVMLALTLGAVLGIVAAAYLLGRKAKGTGEEGDDPLFI